MLRTTAIRLGIVSLIALSAIACGNAAQDLAVGDCFDAPRAADTEITDVVRRECTEPHTGEVVAVFDVPGDGDAAYPTDAAWLESVRGTCVPAFNSYTGRDFDTDPIGTSATSPPRPRLGRWRPRDELLRDSRRRGAHEREHQGRQLSAGPSPGRSRGRSARRAGPPVGRPDRKDAAR